MSLVNENINISDEEWAPVSDLMAVLMLIFMFIAIVFIRTIVVKEEVFKAECDEIFRMLDNEFRHDFKTWNAQLDKDLTIRFNNPDVLFEVGSDKIQPYFKDILSVFFPRYLTVIADYQGDVREIRIEGHTSSEYGDMSLEDAYLQNMRLSQSRTVGILSYVLTRTDIRRDDYDWARDLITANGLSSSKLVDDGGKLIKISGKNEDKNASRRVEFRLVATACQKAGVYDNDK